MHTITMLRRRSSEAQEQSDDDHETGSARQRRFLSRGVLIRPEGQRVGSATTASTRMIQMI
jgi:hypothetical protein